MGGEGAFPTGPTPGRTPLALPSSPARKPAAGDGAGSVLRVPGQAVARGPQDANSAATGGPGSPGPHLRCVLAYRRPTGPQAGRGQAPGSGPLRGPERAPQHLPTWGRGLGGGLGAGPGAPGRVGHASPFTPRPGAPRSPSRLTTGMCDVAVTGRGGRGGPPHGRGAGSPAGAWRQRLVPAEHTRAR